MPTAIDLFEKARSHERLEQLRAAREHDLMPYFRVLEGPAGPVVEMEGAERIMLGSNNYLGLTGDERVKQAARDALERYGTGLTGSRFLNGTLDLHLVLERELADWMGTEDALVFTTGYLANTGAIGTLLEPGDTVICDSGDHASILDAVSLSRARIRPFRHNRLDKLETMLGRAESDGGGVLVVVDGVFSMEGDLAPVPDDRRALPRARGAPDGRRGARRRRARRARRGRLRAVRPARTRSTCAWAPSRSRSPRAAASSPGPHEVIDFLRVQSRSFMFTAAAVPAAVGAALGALRIIRSPEGPELMARVLANARYLHDGLADLGYHVMEPQALPDGGEVITPIVPVLIGDDWKAVLHLEGALRRRRVRERGALPRGAARRRAAAHERDGDPRARAPRPRARDVRPRARRGRAGGAAGLSALRRRSRGAATRRAARRRPVADSR